MADPTIGTFNNSTLSMTQRVGQDRASQSDARAYLQQFEEETPGEQLSNQADTGDARSYLRQFEEGPATPAPPAADRVAGGFDQLPATAMEKPLQPMFSLPFEKQASDYLRQNPNVNAYVGGGLAGLMALAGGPEATFTRYLPALVRTGLPIAKYAAKKFTDYEVLRQALGLGF